MAENRKIIIEQLDDGEVILSANFNAQGYAHEMKAVRLFDEYQRALDTAHTMFRDAGWATEFMSSNGEVDRKYAHPKRDGITDDIPF